MNNLYYTVIKDSVTFILTSVGLIIAGEGLGTWHRQIKGNKLFETSYNLNYAILKLREAIKYVRNPFIPNSEFNKAEEYIKTKYQNNLNKENNSSSIYVYEMRWNKIIEASTEVDSHLLAAEILWGEEIISLVTPLNKKITELNITLQQYFNPEIRTKNSTEIFNIMYANLDPKGKDEFGQEINEIIKKISDYIKNKMS